MALLTVVAVWPLQKKERSLNPSPLQPLSLYLSVRLGVFHSSLLLFSPFFLPSPSFQALVSPSFFLFNSRLNCLTQKGTQKEEASGKGKNHLVPFFPYAAKIFSIILVTHTTFNIPSSGFQQVITKLYVSCNL